MPSSILRRPTPKQHARFFAERTRAAAPRKHKTYRKDTPPSLVAIPEFAPMGAVLIAYPGTVAPDAGREQYPPHGPRSFGIPDELIIRMQQNDSDDPVRIFVMCDPNPKKVTIATMKATICNDLEQTAKEKGLTFNPDHLHLIEWDTDTFWTRDFGPWWIYNETTEYYGIAKHSYTTLGGGSVGLVEGAEDVAPSVGQLGIFRPNDDYGAVKVSDYLNAPIRAWKGKPIKVHNWLFTGLLDVGGNYMVNGTGAIASSYLVATQNELPVTDESYLTSPPPEVIEERMDYIMDQLHRFMGIDTYHVLTDPSGTYIGHIDCWGKFLAESKVLIARSQDEAINAGLDSIADYFKEEDFEVYRVMCQDIAKFETTAAYTNSLILNDHVYVPLAGYEQYDQEALAAYQEALPDHCIVGIIGKPKFPWLGTDAMHCRTRGIPRDVVNNWLKASNPPE